MFSLTGESGAVYLVEDAFSTTPDGRSRLHRCHDRTGHERVVKLYAIAVTDPQAVGWVRAVAARGTAVVLGAEAAGTVADTAESSIDFPIDVLADGQAVNGVVLPVIPRLFLHDDGRPRTFDHLCVTSAHPPPASFRVEVLTRVCDIFAVLDDARLIHGDVSDRNLVWRQDRPHAYLVDSDGLRPVGAPAIRHAGTPGWIDPRWAARRIPAHDEYSDRYGLAVLMYRGLLLAPDAPTLAGGTWHELAGLPADLDPRLRALFDRAFGDPYATDARPTAAQWRDTLRGVFLGEDGTNYRQEAVDALERHARQFGYGAAAMSAAMPGGPGPGGPGPGMAPMPPYGPGAYPGMKKTTSSSAPLIAVAVIVPILLIGALILGIVFVVGQVGRSSRALGASSPDPTTTTPHSLPDPRTTAPYPTTTAPDPPTTYAPPPPPVMHYGAIAVARDGSVGKSWDHGSQAAASRRALNECPRSGCKVLVIFVNSCGAVAYNPRTNRYWGGRGSTAARAKADAISRAGGGHWITWVCTTRPR